MKKTIIFLLVAAALIVGLVLLTQKSNNALDIPAPVSTQNKSTTTPEKNTTSTTTGSVKEGDIKTKPPVPTTPTYTLLEVSQHKTESDCWTATDGNVYDVTAFFGKHPGGDRNILRICGIDGSAAFDRQHGGESRPESILVTFKIGVLK